MINKTVVGLKVINILLCN